MGRFASTYDNDPQFRRLISAKRADGTLSDKKIKELLTVPNWRDETNAPMQSLREEIDALTVESMKR